MCFTNRAVRIYTVLNVRLENSISNKSNIYVRLRTYHKFFVLYVFAIELWVFSVKNVIKFSFNCTKESKVGNFCKTYQSCNLSRLWDRGSRVVGHRVLQASSTDRCHTETPYSSKVCELSTCEYTMRIAYLCIFYVYTT